MRTAAILPVKRFARAKQRLSATVSDELRRELAGAMVADVLDALARTAKIELTIVVTQEQAAAVAAAEHGAQVVADEHEAGQPAAASLGIARALAQGIGRVLCVPGDCPALDPLELEALLTLDGSQAGVVVIPDRHGTGTNGLLLAPPDAIQPSFGPDSCARHRALAQAAGASCRVEHVPSLLLDIDTGEDLAQLRTRLTARASGAPRTRALLAHSAEASMASLRVSA